MSDIYIIGKEKLKDTTFYILLHWVLGKIVRLDEQKLIDTMKDAGKDAVDNATLVHINEEDDKYTIRGKYYLLGGTFKNVQIIPTLYQGYTEEVDHILILSVGTKACRCIVEKTQGQTGYTSGIIYPALISADMDYLKTLRKKIINFDSETGLIRCTYTRAEYNFKNTDWQKLTIKKLKSEAGDGRKVWNTADFVMYMKAMNYTYTLDSGVLSDVDCRCKILHIPYGVNLVRNLFKGRPDKDTKIIFSDTVSSVGKIYADCGDELIELSDIVFQRDGREFEEFDGKGLCNLKISGSANIPNAASVYNLYNNCEIKQRIEVVVDNIQSSFKSCRNIGLYADIKTVRSSFNNCTACEIYVRTGRTVESFNKLNVCEVNINLSKYSKSDKLCICESVLECNNSSIIIDGKVIALDRSLNMLTDCSIGVQGERKEVIGSLNICEGTKDIEGIKGCKLSGDTVYLSNMHVALSSFKGRKEVKVIIDRPDICKLKFDRGVTAKIIKGVEVLGPGLWYGGAVDIEYTNEEAIKYVFDDHVDYKEGNGINIRKGSLAEVHFPCGIKCIDGIDLNFLTSFDSAELKSLEHIGCGCLDKNKDIVNMILGDSIKEVFSLPNELGSKLKAVFFGKSVENISESSVKERLRKVPVVRTFVVKGSKADELLRDEGICSLTYVSGEDEARQIIQDGEEALQRRIELSERTRNRLIALGSSKYKNVLNKQYSGSCRSTISILEQIEDLKSKDAFEIKNINTNMFRPYRKDLTKMHMKTKSTYVNSKNRLDILENMVNTLTLITDYDDSMIDYRYGGKDFVQVINHAKLKVYVRSGTDSAVLVVLNNELQYIAALRYNIINILFNKKYLNASKEYGVGISYGISAGDTMSVYLYTVCYGGTDGYEGICGRKSKVDILNMSINGFDVPGDCREQILKAFRYSTISLTEAIGDGRVKRRTLLDICTFDIIDIIDHERYHDHTLYIDKITSFKDWIKSSQAHGIGNLKV